MRIDCEDDCLLVLLCESIVRICLVVFKDKLDSMILVIWEYSTDKLSLIATGAVLSSAILIDPVNIKQINATKIHDVSNVSDELWFDVDARDWMLMRLHRIG